jgi:hypothetical protein
MQQIIRVMKLNITKNHVQDTVAVILALYWPLPRPSRSQSKNSSALRGANHGLKFCPMRRGERWNSFELCGTQALQYTVLGIVQEVPYYKDLTSPPPLPHLFFSGFISPRDSSGTYANRNHWPMAIIIFPGNQNLLLLSSLLGMSRPFFYVRSPSG